ncbi:MAG: RIP metalloprotease RseP [Nitrospirae bacterium]|nr:RIP metalloprotease RseP [Nitrospirota bacterium]
MTTVISVLIVLGVLIFVHELGHFLFAKWMGVGVLKFSLGLGPRLIGWKWGETEYAISIIPFGGYVKMIGQDDLKVQSPEEISEEERAKSFIHKSPSRRAAIVAAGPVFNFILAFVIFTIVSLNGIYINLPQLGEITEGTPAKAAGFMKDDIVKSIDGRPIKSWDEMVEIVRRSAGKKLFFAVERDGKQMEINVAPEAKKVKNIFGEENEVGQIGVMNAGRFIVEKTNPLYAVYYGALQTWKLTELTVVGLLKMIQGTVSVKEIGGPLQIAAMSGEAASAGILNLLAFIAVISINLAILNLLPIPVLDGGHLLFFAIEGIMGKPLDLKKMEIAQKIGFAILITLIVFAFYNDIMRYSGEIMKIFRKVVGYSV